MFLARLRQSLDAIPTWFHEIRALGWLNLLLFSPLLMGGWTNYSQAGDSLSAPVHYGLAVVIFVMIWASMEMASSVGIVAMVCYLCFMGFVRRELIPSTGYLNNDPLTLISLFVSAVYFLRLLLRQKVPRDTVGARLVLYLLGLMFLEIFNPLQGGLQVGLGGIIFYMVPFFWYFIGKVCGNRPLIVRVVTVFIILSVLAAFRGLYQTFFGLSDHENYWATITGATQSVTVRARRVFSFFLSFSEYVHVLCIGAALCWAYFLNRRFVFLVPFLALFLTVFLSSSRGGVISIFFVMVVLWAVQGRTYRSWMPRLVLALVLGVVGLTLGVEQVKDVQVGNAQAEDFVNHQLVGLSDPLGKKSTGVGHLSMALEGVVSGFRVPMGTGLGSTTLAGAKFASTAAGSTEIDVSNLFVSLGFVGGFLYIAVCVSMLITILRYWHDYRDGLALAVVAVMFVEYGQWLSGAHYLPSMFLWLSLGMLDRVIAVRRLQEARLATRELVPRT